MAESLTHEEALFNAALEFGSTDERSAYLDAACGQQPELRRRVEALLKRFAASAGPLDRGAYDQPTSLDEENAEKPGAIIGPYKLLELIGEGGMGVVYVADQQHPIRRRVALKVIKPGMDSKQVVARFEAERQALAMMDHPNIAHVLDAGATNRGRPYFAMELVKGVPITDYCDQQRLTTAQRLELFLSVCSAVQHAHQKGIIHRDLKPSNVLVMMHDVTPVVKIIDFGIAKAIGQQLSDHSVYTGFSQLVGTPLYMSPEQAGMSSLDVDTRSDIYSLGVLLYELLTGTTPFEAESLKTVGYDEMRRIIREEEPPRPSARLSTLQAATLATVAQRHGVEARRLTHQVRGELDWIVMKALEKDRNRRYETANALATDVQHYLNDEPVQACPPSLRYRVGKFLRNHRVGLSVASGFVALLLAGVTISAWAAVRAGTAERQARQNEKQANEDRDAKDRALVQAVAAARAEQEAKQVAEHRLKQIEKANALLNVIFKDLDPSLEQKGGPALRVQLSQRLEKARQQLDAETISDPEALADIQYTLGNSLLSLGHPMQAIELLSKARASSEACRGADHPYTLLIANSLAAGYWEAGQREKAQSLWEQTLEKRIAVSGPRHPETLLVMSNLGNVYAHAGRFDKALPMLEQTLANQETVVGLGDSGTLLTLANLALAYQTAGQRDKALRLHEQALEKMRAKFGPDHIYTLQSMDNLAVVYTDAGQSDKALSLLSQTLEKEQIVLGPDHPATLMTMNNLATAYHAAGQREKALSLFEATLEKLKAKLGLEHPYTLNCMSNLARAYAETGQAGKAVPMFEFVLEKQKARSRAYPAESVAAMCQLALAYQKAGQTDKALPLLEKTLEKMKAANAPDTPKMLSDLRDLAMAYEIAGHPAKALPLLEQTLEKQKVILGPDHPDTLVTMGDLGLVYQEAGHAGKAVPLLEQTLEKFSARFGPDHFNTLNVMSNLDGAYTRAGQFDKALPLCEKILAKKKAILGPDHPDTLIAMEHLAVCLWRMKKLGRSVPLFEEILRLRTKKLGADHPDSLLAMANLGVNYRDSGKLDEAISALEGAYRKSQKHAKLAWVRGALLQAYIMAHDQPKAVTLIREQLVLSRERLPAESPQLAGELAMLGSLLLKLKAYAEAEPILRECVASRTKLAPEAWTTFNAQSMLGDALLGQKKYQEAEPLLRQGYDGLMRTEQMIPPQAKDNIPEAITRLADLYDAMGKKDQAEAWRKKLENTKHP